MPPEQNQYRLIIRSPVKEVFNAYVESMLLDTDSGQVEIYPGYASFAGTITFSILSAYTKDKNYVFHIKRGILFFSNTNNEAAISAYEAVLDEEVDFTSVQEYLKLIEDKLDKKEDMDSYEYKFLENERLALVKKLDTTGNIGL